MRRRILVHDFSCSFENMVKVIASLTAILLMLVAQIYIGWPTFYANLPQIAPCRWYEHDIPEWTVRVINASCNAGPGTKGYEDIPKSFYKGKIIKRISHLNGTIQNVGCTHNTPKCTEHPYFNYKINKRVNTPPCCREMVLDTLKHITTELQLLNVSHFMTYGNLIGWWRNGEMIPNDHDYDLLVDGKFYHSPKFDEFLKFITKKYDHYCVTAESYKDGGKDVKMKVWVFQSKINRNGGDIWPFDIVKKNGRTMVIVSKYNYASIDQPYDNVFPLKRVTFHGFPVYVPHKVEEYLGLQYGKNGYQTELTCKVFSDMNCLS